MLSTTLCLVSIGQLLQLLLYYHYYNYFHLHDRYVHGVLVVKIREYNQTTKQFTTNFIRKMDIRIEEQRRWGKEGREQSGYDERVCMWQRQQSQRDSGFDLFDISAG